MRRLVGSNVLSSRDVRIPPDLQVARVPGQATIANVSQGGTVLNAPGVGFRYRLWGATFMPRNSVQVPVRWHGRIFDNTVAIIFLAVSGQDFTGGSVFVPGGIVAADNTAITYRLMSSVVPMDIDGLLYYTIEATV